MSVKEFRWICVNKRKSCGYDHAKNKQNNLQAISYKVVSQSAWLLNGWRMCCACQSETMFKIVSKEIDFNVSISEKSRLQPDGSCWWWRHQMVKFSALLAICTGNSLVTGELPAQRPVTHSFDVFFDLHLNKRLSKKSWGWWFGTQSHPLWRHCNINCHLQSINFHRVSEFIFIRCHRSLADVIQVKYRRCLTDRGLGKMDDILRKTFSNTFSSMKLF